MDVGNAAPFLEPFSLDSLPHEFVRGEMKWVFDRAEDGCLACAVFSKGERVHGYVANDAAWTHEQFRPVILDSFQPARTFMSLLRMVRIFPEYTVELKDRTLRVHRGITTKERTLNSMEELRRVMNDEFLMPRCPVERAVAILERMNGADFFDVKPERSLYA